LGVRGGSSSAEAEHERDQDHSRGEAHTSSVGLGHPTQAIVTCQGRRAKETWKLPPLFSGASGYMKNVKRVPLFAWVWSSGSSLFASWISFFARSEIVRRRLL